jgi:hypothetical protein
MSSGGNPWAKVNKEDPKNDMTGSWPNYREPSSFDWSKVDGAILKACFQCAINQGRSLGVGPAMGGRGVVVTLYMGLKTNPKRYAINANELHELLLTLIQAWSSTSEDVVAAMRTGHDTDPPMVAD